jgi:hypothetical protein
MVPSTDQSLSNFSEDMKRSSARHIPLALCCIIWLLLTAGCATPVGVERVDASTAQHQLTANALTADELSPSARNVLRRWVLSERYDDDPAGAIAALHTIATMAAVTKTK